LVFPSKLEDYINESGSNAEKKDLDAYVSFVKFVPSSPKIIVPEIEEEAETTSKKDSLKKEDDVKVKIQELSIGVDAIILPIRPTEDTINGSWQSVEGMGFGNLGSYLSWKLKKTLGGIASTILPQEAVFAMKSGMFGGGIDNPHDILAFAGHSRRSFTIAWDFMKPANRRDEEILTQIVSIFRMSSLGSYGHYVIGPPVSWKVDFYSLPKYPQYLRYRRCGFNSVSAKFGGDERFHAMESGMPFLSLSLDIGELDYPVKDDVWLKKADNSLIRNKELRELTAEEKEGQQKNNETRNNIEKGKK